MNALDLMARLGGEILSNKIRANINGDIVIVARMEGVDWVYTAEGQELANSHSNQAVAEAASQKTRKKAAPAVESADKPADPPAEEQAPAAE
jgi:hypothetical protein